MIRTVYTLLPMLFVATFLYSQENYSELVGHTRFEMIFVKGGTFKMGCTTEQEDYCRDNEKPVRTVTLSDFYIGKFPVTNRIYNLVMGINTQGAPICLDCPVVTASWFEANEFIKRLNEMTGKNYRLPTEAEWEYAARGGASAGSATATIYAGSNDIEAVAWYQESKISSLQPVGLKKPNLLGLYDMSGGVWEWCSDFYGKYDPEQKKNPTGPETGRFRVLRGGSWAVTANHCRVSSRHRYFPNTKTIDFGFRIVHDVN